MLELEEGFKLTLGFSATYILYTIDNSAYINTCKRVNTSTFNGDQFFAFYLYYSNFCIRTYALSVVLKLFIPGIEEVHGMYVQYMV